MGIQLPVISLHQPWASWIAWGYKNVETRGHTRFGKLVGQRVGIHAARKWDRDAWFARRFLPRGAQARLLQKRYPRGAIVATARIWDYGPMVPGDELGALLACHDGVVAYRLTDVVRVMPEYPAKGRQGIWYVEVEEWQFDRFMFTDGEMTPSARA